MQVAADKSSNSEAVVTAVSIEVLCRHFYGSLNSLSDGRRSTVVGLFVCCVHSGDPKSGSILQGTTLSWQACTFNTCCMATLACMPTEGGSTHLFS